MKIGNFVEVKNSVIGTGSKASHLSHIGDAQIGNQVNIGASTVRNYDGEKTQTVIHDGVQIGAHSSLIAPVVVGEQATLGAGTVLVDNAPENQLTISRVAQKTIEGWSRPSDRSLEEK